MEGLKSAVVLDYTDKPDLTDKLGSQKYCDALTSFIKHCSTPMTIAIQGGWGTGKTTTINIVEKSLKDAKGEELEYTPVRFETWQYSYSEKSSVFVPLIQQIIHTIFPDYNEMEGVNEEHKHLDNIINAMSVLEKIAKGGAPIIKKVNRHMGKNVAKFGNVMEEGKHLIQGIQKNGVEAEDEMEGEGLDGFEKLSYFQAIRQLRDNFSKVVEEYALVDGVPKRKLVIFVDDLDRLNPGVAIKLLEDMKNFIECKHCVFVLSLDKNLVKMGFKDKYQVSQGADSENLYDGYADLYFDKLIQLPFFVPTHTYDFTQLIGEKLAKPEVMNLIKVVANNNPRMVKRALNMCDFFKGIPDLDVKDDQLFAILLLQANYEEMYDVLAEKVKRAWDLYGMERFRRFDPDVPLDGRINLFPYPEEAKDKKSLVWSAIRSIFVEKKDGREYLHLDGLYKTIMCVSDSDYVQERKIDVDADREALAEFIKDRFAVEATFRKDEKTNLIEFKLVEEKGSAEQDGSRVPRIQLSLPGGEENKHFNINIQSTLDFTEEGKVRIGPDTDAAMVEQAFLRGYGMPLCVRNRSVKNGKDEMPAPNSFIYGNAYGAYFYRVDLSDDKECLFIGRLMRMLFYHTQIF